MRPALLVLGAALVAADDATPPVQAELVAEARSVPAGGTTQVAVRLRIPDGWHVYWRNPGDSGLPVRVAWTLPSGVTIGELQWPVPQRFLSGPSVMFGYEREVVLPVTLTVAGEVAPDAALTIRGQVRWLACAEACVPGAATVERVLRIGPPAADVEGAALLAAARERLPQDAAAGGVAVRAAARALDHGVMVELDLVGAPVATLRELLPLDVPGWILQLGGGATDVIAGRCRLRLMPGTAPVPPIVLQAVLSTGGAQPRGYAIACTVPAP